MKLDEYLIDKESASVEVGASRNTDGAKNGGTGTLACTPYRLVYVDPNTVTDISLKGVNSIQYREMQYPSGYLSSGVILALAGAVFTAMAMLVPELGEFPTEILWIPAGVGLIGGVGTIIWGFLNQRSTLIVHTPNKSYRFFSTDSSLKEIGHAVRGHEMKS